jgi:hypothetical protein
MPRVVASFALVAATSLLASSVLAEPLGQPAPGAPPAVSWSTDGSTLVPPPGYAPLSAPLRAPLSEQPVMRRRSTPMLVSGIVLSTIGTLGVAGGALLYSSGISQCKDAAKNTVMTGGQHASDTLVDPCLDGAGTSAIGVASMVTGGVFLLTGLPLAVIGGWKVRDETKASPVPRVAVGPGAVRATWRF